MAVSLPQAPLFEVRGVYFRYDDAGPDVLDGVTVTLPAGSTVCVVGKNGSGKSTLLYLLGLLWEGGLRAGEIVYHPGDGAAPLPLAGLPRRAKAALRSRHFGFVLQTGYLMPQLSCAENVALPLLLLGHERASALERARELLRDVGADLAGLHDRPVDTLSGGQAQVMAVLRSIIHDPAVVFADEPTQKLDAKYRESVLDLLGRWRQGAFGDAARRRSLILVLHDAADVCARAEHVLFFTEDHRVRGDRVFLPEDVLREANDERIDHAQRLRQLGYEKRIDRWIKEGR
jgi:ABC-type lipoprotein export system ATPase subunit